jgi:hypothetical protein
MKSYSELLQYLSEKTGISQYEKLPYNVNERRTYHVYGIYDGVEVGLGGTTLKGGIKAFKITTTPKDHHHLALKTFPIHDNDLEEVYQKRLRTLDEYGVPIEIKKSAYKYCEGGGWSSMRDVYIVDGKEFVDYK